MIIIDFFLGSNAEYLNAWNLLVFLTGKYSGSEPKYFYFQELFGSSAPYFTSILILLIHLFIAFLTTKIIQTVFFKESQRN